MEQGATESPQRDKADRLAAQLASLPQRLVWRCTNAGATARDYLEQELAERAGFHWLAVAFGVGCLLYFSLPREPIFGAILAASLMAGAVASLCYRVGAPWRIVALIAICLAGATAAKLRVDGLAGPHIERSLAAEISGRVTSRESRIDRRPRIVLSNLQFETIPLQHMPRRIRVTFSEKYGLPPLGARVSIYARLMPVAGPALPGGYDPRRAAYFEGIGGSGFILGGWTLVEPPRFSADLVVARIRAAIVARIMAAEPGEAGAVAAALLVGERSALSEETNESLRISGLAHILSISGLHMMLIAGTAFFVVRAGLALSPPLALSRPIRKWAAIAALIVVTLYMTLSGGGAATLRAYVMAVIMFAAILVDRPAISMRNLAVAAFIVLMLEPESVTEPGFQMSFGAVAALIAAWEAWHDRRRMRLMDDDALPGLRLARSVGRAVAGVAVTTLVAGLATAPFAAYHFERVASYSLLGNLLAAPLVSIIIMPFGLLALVVMPLGLEAPPLYIMARGIDALLRVSDWVAGLPGADITAPPMPPVSLLLMAAGMLWLCLWRLRWRLLGLPAIGAGLLLVPVLNEVPDILIAPDGTSIAVRDQAGMLRVSGSRAGSYMIEQFFDEEPGPPPGAAELRKNVRCDELACLLTAVSGIAVAHVTDPAAFAEDCRRAEIIATPLDAPSDCGASLVIDGPQLMRFGAHAVRIESGEIGSAFFVTAERSATPRPWQAGGATAAAKALNTSAEGR